MDPWQQILKFVETRISKQNYNTWFKPSQSRGLDQHNTLLVAVPNEVFEDWLNKHYTALIQEAIQANNLGSVRIVFRPEAERRGNAEGTTAAVPVQKTLDFDAVYNLLLSLIHI